MSIDSETNQQGTILKHENKSYSFIAESKGDYNEWIKAINDS